VKEVFYPTSFANILSCAGSLLISWTIFLEFPENHYHAILWLCHFAFAYEIGYKEFYRKNRKIIFFILFLFPSVFTLSFIIAGLVSTWMALP
jgi:hypothetical protein